LLLARQSSKREKFATPLSPSGASLTSDWSQDVVCLMSPRCAKQLPPGWPSATPLDLEAVAGGCFFKLGNLPCSAFDLAP
jgi:hypothetical protein